MNDEGYPQEILQVEFPMPYRLGSAVRLFKLPAGAVIVDECRPTIRGNRVIFKITVEYRD